jgi:hypothetical protein
MIVPEHIRALARTAHESNADRLVLADWLEEAGFGLDAEALRDCPSGPIPYQWWWYSSPSPEGVDEALLRFVRYGNAVQTLNALDAGGISWSGSEFWAT